MAFMMEWIRPDEELMTAKEVKRLPAGTKVTVIGSDRRGQCCRGEYHVTPSGKSKVLTTMDWQGNREVLMIRDYPGKRYVREKQ